MKNKILWTVLTPPMPTSDAEMLLDSLKTFKVVKSHQISCGLCSHAVPHAMRVRLLACKCPMCAAVVPFTPCPWRGKTLACQHINLMRVEEAGVHVSPAPSPVRPRLTSAMKEVSREWAAQGLKPERIRSGFLRRLNLDETSLPPLSVVQRFVHNYAYSHLRNNDILDTVKAKIYEAAYHGSEEESEAFTFTWTNDSTGRPIVGNGSDDTPFTVGVSTKKLLQRADREPDSFVLHVDGTYNLCQVAYPVLVVGISDKVRQFHLVAIVIMSQQMQLHYTRALSALRKVYLKVAKKPLLVRYVMTDADKAQRNGIDEVFGGDCSLVHLMCYFHVAKKVYEKAKGLEPTLFAMVLRDLHDLHFTVDGVEYEKVKSRVLAEWAKRPGLEAFTTYFTNTWLTGRFVRWQMYHTPPGMATTNNPVEQYNAVIKRDVTVHRKIKMGLLLDRLLEWCMLESSRSVPFAVVSVADKRLQRRARELERQHLLSEYVMDRHSIAFMLGNTPPYAEGPDTVYVRAVAASRPHDELQRRRHEGLPTTAQLGLHTARMETMGMPAEGWKVNVREILCGCRFYANLRAARMYSLHLMQAAISIFLAANDSFTEAPPRSAECQRVKVPAAQYPTATRLLSTRHAARAQYRLIQRTQPSLELFTFEHHSALGNKSLQPHLPQSRSPTATTHAAYNLAQQR